MVHPVFKYSIILGLHYEANWFDLIASCVSETCIEVTCLLGDDAAAVRLGVLFRLLHGHLLHRLQLALGLLRRFLQNQSKLIKERELSQNIGIIPYDFRVWH